MGINRSRARWSKLYSTNNCQDRQSGGCGMCSSSVQSGFFELAFAAEQQESPLAWAFCAVTGIHRFFGVRRKAGRARNEHGPSMVQYVKTNPA